MLIAGFQKQSLIDYPGNISSVVFTQGCNFRCGFCHNPNLVLPKYFEDAYAIDEIFAYLNKYRNLLSAVVITGGEPTIHKDLPDFIASIRDLGLKVKLDSNGSNPQMLKNLISKNFIDCIAMDIKHVINYQKYNSAVGNILCKKNYQDILESIELIKSSNIDYEFRTTIVKGLHSIEEIKTLKKQFAKHYKLQHYKPAKTINTTAHYSSFTNKDLLSLM